MFINCNRPWDNYVFKRTAHIDEIEWNQQRVFKWGILHKILITFATHISWMRHWYGSCIKFNIRFNANPHIRNLWAITILMTGWYHIRVMHHFILGDTDSKAKGNINSIMNTLIVLVLNLISMILNHNPYDVSDSKTLKSHKRLISLHLN